MSRNVPHIRTCDWLLLAGIFGKPVVVQPGEAELTSDARLKRQTAKAEHELVELEQVRNDLRPLLLGVLQHTKSLYPDCTKDTHLIVNALVDRLAIEVSKDESKDTQPNSVRSSKRRMPR